MDIPVTVDTRAAVAALEGMAKQLPFVAKTAVNRLGMRVQAVERGGIGERFTVRRTQFINQQGVKVLNGFATKQRQSITIGPSEKASALSKFEAGGIKQPTGGQSIAVPVAARRNKTDVIATANRPRQLLASLGPPPTGAGARPKKRGRPKSIRALMRAGKSLFVVRLGDHDPRSDRLKAGIYQRLGTDHRAKLKMWYRLTRRTRVPAALELRATAQRVVQAEGGAIMAAAVSDAIKSAKP